MDGMYNLYISGNVRNVDILIMKVVVLMNIELVIEVANRVNDEDSVILWDIIKGWKNGKYNDDKNDIIYGIALSMLEEMEGEEE